MDEQQCRDALTPLLAMPMPVCDDFCTELRLPPGSGPAAVVARLAQTLMALPDGAERDRAVREILMRSPQPSMRPPSYDVLEEREFELRPQASIMQETEFSSVELPPAFSVDSAPTRTEALHGSPPSVCTIDIDACASDTESMRHGPAPRYDSAYDLRATPAPQYESTPDLYALRGESSSDPCHDSHQAQEFNFWGTSGSSTICMPSGSSSAYLLVAPTPGQARGGQQPIRPRIYKHPGVSAACLPSPSTSLPNSTPSQTPCVPAPPPWHAACVPSAANTFSAR